MNHLLRSIRSRVSERDRGMITAITMPPCSGYRQNQHSPGGIRLDPEKEALGMLCSTVEANHAVERDQGTGNDDGSALFRIFPTSSKLYLFGGIPPPFPPSLDRTVRASAVDLWCVRGSERRTIRAKPAQGIVWNFV